MKSAGGAILVALGVLLIIAAVLWYWANLVWFSQHMVELANSGVTYTPVFWGSFNALVLLGSTIGATKVVRKS